jgi:hypothetical protein
MKTALSSLVVLILVSGRASAALVNDNFDSYVTQEAFEAVWAPIGTQSPVSGLYSAMQAASSPFSIEFPSSSLDGQHQNQLTFSPTPLLGIGDALVWSFDFYDSLPIGRPQRHYATLQTSAGAGASPAGQVISLGMNNNQFQDESGGNFFMAGIQGYSQSAVDPDGGPNEDPVGIGPGVFFKLNDTEVRERDDPPGWHNLKLIITTSDGTTADHAYYVDDMLAETVSDVGPIHQYSVIRLGSGLSNGGRVAYFDNMQLEFVAAAVPEAGSFLAMGVVGLLSAGAIWIRKRRAAA